MSLRELSPEQWAELFRGYHWALGDGFDWRGFVAQRLAKGASKKRKDRARSARAERCTADHHQSTSRRGFASRARRSVAAEERSSHELQSRAQL